MISILIIICLLLNTILSWVEMKFEKFGSLFFVILNKVFTLIVFYWKSQLNGSSL